MPLWAAILLAIAVTPLFVLVWWNIWGDDITKLFKKEKKMFKVNEMPWFKENTIVVCKNDKNAGYMFNRTAEFLSNVHILFSIDSKKREIEIIHVPGSIRFMTESQNKDGLRGRLITPTAMENWLDQCEQTFKREQEKHNMSINGINLFASSETGTTNEQDIWIWIEGYKGTNKDLTCRDYQFELGKQFDMPEGATIRTCSSGFHLCVNLKDTFKYYSIKDGHRFFRVRALVRKSDFDEFALKNCGRDKIVAKSILFMYEMTADEILQASEIETSKWTDEDKLLALEKGTKHVELKYRKVELTELGYSETFSQYLIDNGMSDIAKAVGSQPDLSMDMKVLMILKGEAPLGINRIDFGSIMANAAASARATSENMRNAFNTVRW